MPLEKVFTVNVDLKEDSYAVIANVVQNDSVVFVVNITEDGLPKDLTNVASYSIAHTRPDNIVVATLGSKTGSNQATFKLGATELLVPGRVSAMLQLYDAEGRVSSSSLTYTVVKDPTGSGFIPSEDDRTLIEEVLIDGPAIIQEAQETASNTQSIATQMQTDEAIRVTNESTRQTNESTRQTNETTRGTNETTRQTNETARQTNETNRGTAETARVNAESARVTAENSRVTAETGRVTAESSRASAETGRVNAESARVTAESTRVTAESARASAETTRGTNESTRQTNETTRQTNETNRGTAETGRVNAESSRVTAETGRVTAETGRTTAESNRVTAETGRAGAETTRGANEAARQTNETTRQTNETARQTAITAVRHRGPYNAGTAYSVNNSVEYGGSTYRCILASTGNLPTNTTYWVLEAAAGSVASVSSANGDITVINPTSSPELTLNSSTVAGTADKIVKRKPDGSIDEIGLLTNLKTTSKSSIVGSVNEIADKLSSAAVLPVTLKRGWNYILANESSPLNVTLQGRTLVNLLGKDGGCESLTPFTTSLNGSSSIVASSTQKKNGNNSIKITASGGYSGCFKDFPYPLDTTKQYVIGGWVYIESWTSGLASIYLRDYLSNSTRYQVWADTSKIGSWQFIYIKVPTANTIVGNGFRLLFGTTSAVDFVAYFDDIRLYELSSTDYNAIGTTYTTSTTPSIDDFIPYVDSVQSLKGVYLSKPGKNMLPPFTEWTLHANAVVTEPYKLTLNATGVGQVCYVEINVVPNVQYYLSVTHNARIGVYKTDGATAIAAYTDSQGLTFNSGLETKVRVYLSNLSAGTFTFTNPQLELGSVATAFEPRNDDYLYVPTTLAGMNGVYDTFDFRTGRVLRRWKDIVLDGSLAWTYSNDYAGFKRVYFQLPGAMPSRGPRVVKYNGMVLTTIDSSDLTTTKTDSAYVSSSPNFTISISDTDSGWGESYTPTDDDIKAYFYGWRMCADGGVGTLYNGTGTKAWHRIQPDGTVESAAAVTIAPTTQGISGVNYKLIYQLATAVDEPVTDLEGSISLHAGGNQVEYGEGVIVREKVTPVQAVVSPYAFDINNTASSTTKFKNATNKILRVYKNDVIDNKWVIRQNRVDGYGGANAYILPGDYDPTAKYTVTYVALDKYSMTTNVTEAASEYQGNIEMVLRDTVKKQADIVEAVSILQSSKSSLVGSVNEISNKLSSASVLPVTVKRGWNYITANESAPLNVIIQGRTLVNLLGKDGNCEDASKWADDFFATHSLDSANKVYGSNSIKIAVGTGGSAGAIHPFSQPLFVPGKYYVAIADVKNGNATSIMLELSNGSASSWEHSDTTKFSPLCMAFPYTTAQPRVTVIGSEYEYGYVDGYRIYEITQAEYNELDTMSVDKIAKKYPYVDSIKHLSGAYLSKPGKNLLPPFSDSRWGINSEATVIYPYKLAVTSGTLYRASMIDIPFIVGQQYTLNVGSITGCQAALRFYDSTGTELPGSALYYSHPITSKTFTIPAGTVRCSLVFQNNSTGGTYTFTNPILVLGTSYDGIWEPSNDDYLYVPTTLAGVNGVYDTFDSKKGRVLRRWKDVVLDGSLPWAFHTDNVGSKQVRIDNLTPNVIDGTKIVQKYDGKVINTGLADGKDGVHYGDTSVKQNLYLSIPDTNSGWGENDSLSVSVIKAYFNGWKWRAGEPVATWESLLNSSITSTDEYYVTNNYAPGHTPYKLTYQLATAVDEPVSYLEGSISLHAGGNQVEYGEGMIVREPIIPLLAAGKYQIGGFNANLKRKVKSIVQVFRNGVPDNQWSHYLPGDGYGNLDAVDILVGNYDSTAEYTVTYMSLDTYAITTNVTEASAEYQGNIEMVLRELTKRQTDITEAVSILQATKANRGQGQWLPITLLSGWINTAVEAVYYKDEFGEVHIRGKISSGITSAATGIFRLPKGYRPAKELEFPIISHNGTAYVLGSVVIYPDGNVGIWDTIGNVALNLQIPSFRAEQ